MANIAALIQQTGARMGLTPAQIKVLIAGAKVESGLDPTAVGDGGTSYGLYQMHVGGAGGKTHEEAQRYLDPLTAIENRARFVKQNNITTGAQFAALQRPADPAGYAKKVDAALRGVSVDLNAPVKGGTAGGSAGAAPATATSTPARAGAASYGLLAPAGSGSSVVSGLLGERDTFLKDLLDRSAARVSSSRMSAPIPMQAPAQAAPAAAPAATAAPSAAAGAATKGGVPPRKPGETGQQYLDRVLIAKFGLKHDPGNSQTTAGNHTTNSYHYRGGGQATDFGNARNDEATLDAAKAWVDANAAALGIAESLDEGDHRHFATIRSAQKGGKQKTLGLL